MTPEEKNNFILGEIALLLTGGTTLIAHHYLRAWDIALGLSPFVFFAWCVVAAWIDRKVK